jgi:hypothetical protein
MTISTISGDWNEVWITDKTGRRFFNTSASPMSTPSEIKNLKRHLDQSKTYRSHYSFLDIDSAVLMLNGTVYYNPSAPAIDVDSLLAELGL